jgi:DNA-binding transcriptional MerR regulator
METAMARRTRRIGDVAREAGVGVETVRFYEREGLIARPKKPERGWREYDTAQLRQLGYVRLARELGLTLADIKKVQAVSGGPQADFCDAVRHTVTARLEAVEAEIAALNAKRESLSAWLSQCHDREGPCPLYRQLSPLAPQKTRKRN